MALSFIEQYGNCPLCDNAQLSMDFSIDVGGELLKWSRCDDCTLVFQNPRLTEASLNYLYGASDYFGLKQGEGEATPGYRNYTDHDAIRIQQARRRVSRIMDLSGAKNGRLLDIGSASGSFGVAAREAGFDVTCVEPSQELAEFGRLRYGLNFMAKPIEACDFEPMRFDIITLWGTDSHFMHPLHSFRRIASALKPGGFLAMNYQDFSHWIRLILPGIKTRWNVIYNFTDKSFDLLMRKLGLSLIVRELEWQTVTMDHLAKALNVPLTKALRRGAVRVPAISLRFVVVRKAVWPAGQDVPETASAKKVASKGIS